MNTATLPAIPPVPPEIDGWTRKRQRQVIWSFIALIVGAWVHPLVAVATIRVVTVRMAKLELTEAKLRKRVLIQALSRS